MSTQPPLKYRNAETGETWTGRGMQPAWLKAAMAQGAKLADFEVHPAPAAATPIAVVGPATVPAPAGAAAVSALAKRLRYEGATDPATLENSAREAIRRIGMGIFELGGYLLLLREATEKGQFLPALERLGLEPRSAQHYMAVTRRFATNAKSISHLESTGIAKLVELLPLDDEQVEDLLETGQTGELALDDVATMSVKQLRAAVREEREERLAQEEVSAAKSKQIDRLQRQLKRVQAAPPDEVMAELKKEATAIAHNAQGLIMGALRQALRAITSHQVAEDGVPGIQVHRAFLAGLLAPVQAELSALRAEFDLVDLSEEAPKPGWVAFAEAEDAAAAEAAAKADPTASRG